MQALIAFSSIGFGDWRALARKIGRDSGPEELGQLVCARPERPTSASIRLSRSLTPRLGWAARKIVPPIRHPPPGRRCGWVEAGR
jgi:hypothetical protein